MTTEEITSILVEYLERKKPVQSMADIAELKYLDAGYVDSLGFMKFLMFMEERFDIEFDDDEIESEAFRTIGGLGRLIEAKCEEHKPCR